MTVDTTALLWFLLDVSLRACAAAIAAAVVLEVLNVRAAAVRHAVWTTVLGAMLLMPLLPSLVPALPLPAITRSAPAADEVSPQELAVADQPLPVPPVPVAAPAIGLAPGDLDPQSARGPQQVRQSSSRPSWPLVLASLYAAGALLFLGRLARGWRLVAGLLRRARRGGAVRLPSGLGTNAGIYQSSEIAAPLTAGVIHPMVILPTAWRKWTPDVLTAVVAHEMAHVRRRDGLVLLIARLNRAVFWFHPLAWWLERQLAVTAEHACDEAASVAVPEPRRYAEILVEMADAVRRHRGRVAWPAVGVDGAGALEGRIDRVLSGSFGRTSRARAAATLIWCAAAITLIVACRQDPSVPPLREDPELTKRLAQQDDSIRKSEAARDMTQAQADDLEKQLETNPMDFDARRQLVIYYSQSSTVAWDKKVPGLRRHALWLIEHHPEHDVRPPSLSPQYDPEGFAAAKKLWQAHLAKPDASPYRVYRAASFLLPHDKPYAEELILRGMKMDPDSTAIAARVPPSAGGFKWQETLAFLYASALQGSETVWGTYNDFRTHLEWLNTPYAMEVRRKLDASTDAILLTRVGQLLSQVRPGNAAQLKDENFQKAVAMIRDMGVRYLERAVELDPNLESAKRSLFRASYREEDSNDAERSVTAAKRAYYSRRDANEGKRLAEEALQAAQPHANDPSYAVAIMEARHLLASIGAGEGDHDAAVRHLQESVKVPASDEIKYLTPITWMKPVNELLKAGERDRVADFLDAFGQLVGTGAEGDRFRNDAKAIREGRMPSAYQHAMYRETTPSPFKPRQ